MFLHSGASLHGHEYSSKRSSSAPLQPPKRLPLLRAAWRPLNIPSVQHDGESKSTTSASDLATSRRASADLSPRTSRPSSLLLRQRAASNSFTTKKELGVRFQEPGTDQIHTPSASEDEESIAGSDLTDVAIDTPRRHRKRQRLPRQSTRYALAQPAPQLRTKQRRLVQIRPRLLLQLQEIGDRRAMPAFDIIPSHLVAGTLIIIPRLAKRFPRVFHANADLTQNDVLLVRSEDYGLQPASTLSSGHGSHQLRDRDILAVISALPGSCQQASAEIVLEDGSSWYANVMANGSYEFTKTSPQGETTTARWVRRSGGSARNSTASVDPSLPKSSLFDATPDSKWTFSIIDPSSRRHPIMGTITAETMEIYDTYNTLSTSSGRYPPSRPFGPETGGGRDRSPSPAGLAKEERETLKVLPEQKTLMMATASWIRLHQQGWPDSANPKLSRSVSSHCRSASISGTDNRRRQTFPTYDGDSSRAASPLNSCHSPDSMEAAEASSKRNRTVPMPSRTMSTGRAFMNRRSARVENPLSNNTQFATPHHQMTEKLMAQEEYDDSSHTCFGKVKSWTQKLFRRK